MEKQEGKYLKFILIPIYVLFFVSLLFVVSVTVFMPQDNLIPKQTFLMALGVPVVSLTAFFLWNKYYKDSKFNLVFYIIFLLFYAAILYLAGMYLGDRWDLTLGDYYSVRKFARQIASGTHELTDYEYLLIYNNNIKPVLFLSVFLKTARFFHFTEFFFTMVFSVLQTVITVWAVNVLLEKNKDKKWNLITLFLSMICLPIYVFTSMFYTDMMSYGLGIILLALIKISMSKKGFIKYALIVFSAFLFIYAMQWKITAIFPVIAAAIVLVTRGIKKYKNEILVFVIATATFYLLSFIWGNTYPVTKESKETSNPSISWFAMGLKGDGSYLENKNFVDELNSLPTKKMKTEFSIERIKEGYKEGLTFNHQIRKAHTNFAGGSLGSKNYLTEFSDGSFFWDLLSPWGKYYWRTSQYNFCFIIMIYMIILLGAALSIIDLIRGKKLPVEKMIADISFLGIIIFLMLWEANCRQMFNQIPVLILGAVANGRYIVGKINKKHT